MLIVTAAAAAALAYHVPDTDPGCHDPLYPVPRYQGGAVPNAVATGDLDRDGVSVLMSIGIIVTS